MKVTKTIQFLLTVLLFTIFNTQAKAQKDTWGQSITIKNAKSLENAIEEYANNKDKEILIEAQVGKVCEKKGCWMTLKAKDKNVRVTFKDYGFFVPPHLLDKKVQVQGKLVQHEMNLAEAKHFASDAGVDPKRVKSPVREFRMISTGVKLLKN